MRRAALIAALVAAVVGSWASIPPARADFTPLTLISGTTAEESDYALEPAISADGQYVVYAGSQAGVTGIFRKNLGTGVLEMVAAGDAGAPSISADGRFVSFTTTATDPATGNGRQCSSVYLRDMSVPADQPGAYTLASALNGTTAGLVYGGSATAGCPGGGSAAADRVALSADGSQVAFTVVGASDLTAGAGGPITTPPDQVAVRDLSTDTTTLVSQTQGSIGLAPQPVPGGAAMTDNSTGTGPDTGTHNSAPGDSTAAISADGTTVAWLGINIPAQAPASSADQPNGHGNEYDEPLWRRIAGGPSAPTLRILGGSAPDEPCPSACDSPLDTQWSGEENPTPGLDQGPERGSFIDYDGFTSASSTSRSTLDDATPQLSANGQVVAMLSTQPATGADPECSETCSSDVSANAYVVNLAPGLTRPQAVTRLTEWASEDFTDFSLAGPIENLAISPEGNRVAFVTRRLQFPLSPPALITPQLSGAENEQLYLADLSDGTLQLVSLGYDGQAANGVVDSPSLSAADGPLVFASSATNLVFGAFSDITGGGEVFATTEVKPPAVPGVETISSPPPNPTITPEWVMGVTARRQADGSMMLFVTVPGAGTATATARSSVPAPTARVTRHNAARRRRRHRRTPAVVTRTVASAHGKSRAAAVMRLHLRAASSYHSLLSRTHGLYATVRVSFTTHGRPRLTDTLPIDFTHAAAARKRKKR